MSYSSHRRAVLDATAAPAHRASHARSCALLIAGKLGVHRDAVIAWLQRKAGIDLNIVNDHDTLLRVQPLLDALRVGHEDLHER